MVFGFLDCVRRVPDHRISGMTTYPLDEILLTVLVAVVCGADDWEAVEAVVEGALGWLRGFNTRGVEAAIRAQKPPASAESLFGVRPAGEHRDDQRLRVRPDLAGPTSEPFRRPLGGTPVGTGHMFGVRAVLAADIATLVDGDALAQWNTSTTRAVTRSSTSARMSVCGTE
jgi:hypothetical protein